MTGSDNNTQNNKSKKGNPIDNKDFKNIAKEVALFARKVNSLSKSVDFFVEEAMPALFKEDNIEEVYSNCKKGMDFIMRHLI